MPIAFSTLDKQTRLRPMPGLDTYQSIDYPEAASADFQEGEIVVISTSGGVDYVTHSVTAPAAGAVSASLAAGDLVLGIALKGATGTTGTKIPVALANEVEVLTRIYAAAAADAQVQDVAVGDLAELFRYKATSGGGIFMVASAAANGTDGINKVSIVERYDLNDGTDSNDGNQGLTDTYAMAWVRFRPTLTVFGR